MKVIRIPCQKKQKTSAQYSSVFDEAGNYNPNHRLNHDILLLTSLNKCYASAVASMVQEPFIFTLTAPSYNVFVNGSLELYTYTETKTGNTYRQTIVRKRLRFPLIGKDIGPSYTPYSNSTIVWDPFDLTHFVQLSQDEKPITISQYRSLNPFITSVQLKSSNVSLIQLGERQ